MSANRVWISISLLNLCIVALLGFMLRSKILFPIGWMNYSNWINAHSHFAFAGWVTLSLCVLFTRILLPESLQNRKLYGAIFWGLEIASVGMLFSFPFTGYGAVSIFFSTLLILCTYAYTWLFIKDIKKGDWKNPWGWLSIGALICVSLSSLGPFTLAYIMASKIPNAVLYKDALYFYLHFQYNGFFTLGIFAILFRQAYKHTDASALLCKRFALCLCLGVVPSFFLSLLWHTRHPIVMLIATGSVIISLVMLYYFFQLYKVGKSWTSSLSTLSRTLFLLISLSFVIKTLLQVGTIIPTLGTAVFGLRPVIIGFLHLVFLGLVSFYILLCYIELNVFSSAVWASVAIKTFIAAVIGQEAVLLIQGVGLLMGTYHSSYNWILWVISMLLFLSTFLLFLAGSNLFKKRYHLSGTSSLH